jgi:diacylglycerol kinase (ATP)
LVVTLVRPPDQDALSERIRAAAADCDRVIIGGGDGTLHAALPALLESGLPLGVLPMGTANDFARSLGLPRELEEAAGIIAADHCRAVDVSRVNGVPFLNAASVGLGVAVTRALSGSLKERWRGLSYARALAAAAAEARAFRVHIDCDGKAETVVSLQITVGNGRYYGGGMTIAASARVDDGKLYLYSIEPQSLWQLMRLLPAMRSGRHGRYEEVFTRAGECLRVETAQSMPVTADGELCASTPALFEVLPEALSVFVAASDESGRQHVPK